MEPRPANDGRLLGCSVRTLSRASQAVTGTGARQVIDEHRLFEARRLLGHARWTARAVADPLGCTDTADFGRFFRHHTGLTPAAYAARQATPAPRHSPAGGYPPSPSLLREESRCPEPVSRAALCRRDHRSGSGCPSVLTHASAL
ncbi:helix-turn-helix domain-containing protein [Streptomyces sp. WM6386]|uniref:helix-turn-helix domain-containing protein n=1 Tax=Streptomyces sp. WM6386 TaxID=1415558 RepID=UPI003B63E342